MGIYEELGIEPIINAAGTYTAVGGSRMSEKTLQDMADAARVHVEIPVLQKVVQERIAHLTQNEASAVCNGAASGLYLCAVSAIALKLGKKSRFLTKEEIAAHEIVSFHAQHIPYDFAIEQLGVAQVWVGYPNITGSMVAEDLEAVLKENTAAIYYFISSPYGLQTPGILPLEEVIAIGKKHNIPVIVDAAAQLPPVENLWVFTSMGAAAAIFSGGKYLKGPQSSGIILGRKFFLEKVQETNFPNYGYGRMFKTGREEIAGIYSAVKQYVYSDHREQQDIAERMLRQALAALENSSLYRAERVYPNEAAQPMAYLRISLKKAASLQQVVELMRKGNPAVFVKQEGQYFYINPMTLLEKELSFVIEKLIAVEKLI